MANFRKICAVAGMNFCHWLKDIRVRFIFLCMTIFIVYYLLPVTRFCLNTGVKTTPFLLAALMKETNISVGTAKVVVSIGMLLLLCDAPFWNPVSPYMVMRSKRNGWWLGECLYVVMAAFVYVVFVTIVSTLVVLPVASLTEDWGQAWHLIIFGSDEEVLAIRSEYQLFVMPSGLAVAYLYPFQTQLYCFFAMWGCYSMLGLITYLISLITKNLFLGMGTAGVLVFVDPLMMWMFGLAADRPQFVFSPVSWISPEQLDLVERGNHISVPYTFGMYVVLCVLLCAAIGVSSRRIELNFIAE